jgi:hypothetical protein
MPDGDAELDAMGAELDAAFADDPEVTPLALNPTPMPTAPIRCRGAAGVIYFKVGPEEMSFYYNVFVDIVLQNTVPPHWLVWEAAKIVAGGGAAVDLNNPSTVVAYLDGKTATGTKA